MVFIDEKEIYDSWDAFHRQHGEAFPLLSHRMWIKCALGPCSITVVFPKMHKWGLQSTLKMYMTCCLILLTKHYISNDVKDYINMVIYYVVLRSI